jgi:hypothetical protein
MIHALTMGHIDADAVGHRRAAVRQPLDMGIVERLLGELGEADVEGCWRLGGSKVEFYEGYIAVPWLGGGTNYVAEEFALRLQRDTACVLADREHGRVIAPEQLQGVKGLQGAVPEKSGRGHGRSSG